MGSDFIKRWKRLSIADRLMPNAVNAFTKSFNSSFFILYQYRIMILKSQENIRTTYNFYIQRLYYTYLV